MRITVWQFRKAQRLALCNSPRRPRRGTGIQHIIASNLTAQKGEPIKVRHRKFLSRQQFHALGLARLAFLGKLQRPLPIHVKKTNFRMNFMHPSLQVRRHQRINLAYLGKEMK